MLSLRRLWTSNGGTSSRNINSFRFSASNQFLLQPLLLLLLRIFCFSLVLLLISSAYAKNLSEKDVIQLMQSNKAIIVGVGQISDQLALLFVRATTNDDQGQQSETYVFEITINSPVGSNSSNSIIEIDPQQFRLDAGSMQTLSARWSDAGNALSANPGINQCDPTKSQIFTTLDQDKTGMVVIDCIPDIKLSAGKFLASPIGASAAEALYFGTSGSGSRPSGTDQFSPLRGWPIISGYLGPMVCGGYDSESSSSLNWYGIYFGDQPSLVELYRLGICALSSDLSRLWIQVYQVYASITQVSSNNRHHDDDDDKAKLRYGQANNNNNNNLLCQPISPPIHIGFFDLNGTIHLIQDGGDQVLSIVLSGNFNIPNTPPQPQQMRNDNWFFANVINRNRRKTTFDNSNNCNGTTFGNNNCTTFSASRLPILNNMNVFDDSGGLLVYENNVTVTRTPIANFFGYSPDLYGKKSSPVSSATIIAISVAIGVLVIVLIIIIVCCCCMSGGGKAGEDKKRSKVTTKSNKKNSSKTNRRSGGTGGDRRRSSASRKKIKRNTASSISRRGTKTSVARQSSLHHHHHRGATPSRAPSSKAIARSSRRKQSSQALAAGASRASSTRGSSRVNVRRSSRKVSSLR